MFQARTINNHAVDAEPDASSIQSERRRYWSDRRRGRRANRKPQTVDELTQRNVRTILKLEEVAKEKRTQADRVADVISTFCGSMWFVWVHVAWFCLWIGFNLAPAWKEHRFDAFPFTFLTLMVSLEAIFLSSFIMISQNHEQRMSERRNHLDLQINLLSEQENTKMLQMLKQIAEHIGVKVDDDPSVAVLEAATRPEKLLEQIDRSIEKSDSVRPDRKPQRAAQSQAA
jgi:uncharacterized membrane protein